LLGLRDVRRTDEASRRLWNDASRFATVDALVADHSFAIDGSGYAAATGDKIRVRAARSRISRRC